MLKVSTWQHLFAVFLKTISQYCLLFLCIGTHCSHPTLLFITNNTIIAPPLIATKTIWHLSLPEGKKIPMEAVAFPICSPFLMFRLFMGLYSTKCCGVSNDSSDPHSLNKTIPPWFRGFIGVCVFRKRQNLCPRSAPLLWQRLSFSCGQKGNKSELEGEGATFPHPALSLGHWVHTGALLKLTALLNITYRCYDIHLLYKYITLQTIPCQGETRFTNVWCQSLLPSPVQPSLCLTPTLGEQRSLLPMVGDPTSLCCPQTLTRKKEPCTWEGKMLSLKGGILWAERKGRAEPGCHLRTRAGRHRHTGKFRQYLLQN